MRARSPFVLAVLVPLLLASGARGENDGRPLVERVYELTRRPAAAAVERICPMLSARGSVEVQDGGRTLVVRDVEPHVELAMTALRTFDQAGRTLRVAVQIVRAEARAPGGGEQATLELPADVVDRLHRLLRYRSYSLLARAELEAPEEVESTFEVGPEFRVSFRPDRDGEPGQVRMREFRVSRRTGQGDHKPLVHTHLSLEMGRPMILGLAPTEASERALMVVLRAEPRGLVAEAHG